MVSGGDAAEQLVRLELEGVQVVAKIVGSGAKNLAILLASILKQKNKSSGAAKLATLIRNCQSTDYFKIQNKDVKKFVEEAKRYGVFYCVCRDKNAKGDNEPVGILFDTKDAHKVQHIVEDINLSVVDRARMVTGAQQENDRNEVAQERPTKSKNEVIMEEAVRSPLQKEQNAPANPTVAKTEKDPLSGQDLKNSPEKTLSEEGSSKAERKPSIKEKLDRYVSEAKKRKETERTEPETEKPKSQKKTQQTVHQQPKRKSKKQKER